MEARLALDGRKAVGRAELPFDCDGDESHHRKVRGALVALADYMPNS